MREKIFSICHEFGIGNLSDKEVIDQILSYQSEEIKKVENPYDTTAGGFEEAHWEAFSLAQGKILALLK